MYVEEVIIDGFKSYATRTVVNGFDPSFNAITGLNGSGKSNILDSICFVLGISSLSQVRVSNLQELVYKGGQAGVSKATVSIVFNNADRTGSPAGYEDCKKVTVTRQIVVGGKNKYLINGHVAQPGRVQSLFHSVQLNVNNPHFLIMQGRITKVINMKPPEVLSMIDEAAGTRMYELKKEAALKTIHKKQKKVEEIEEMLQTEITPMLEKLRRDRAAYMKWCSNSTRLEQLNRFTVAYDYWRAQQKVLNADEERKKLMDGMDAAREKQRSLQEQSTEVERLVKKLIEQRDSRLSARYKQLQKEVEDLDKNIVKETSALASRRDVLQTESAAGENLERNISENLAQLARNESAQMEMEEKVAHFVSECTRLANEEEQAQRTILTGSAGGQENAKDAVGSSVANQMQAMSSGLSAAESELESLQLRVGYARDELKEKSKRARQEQDAIDAVRHEQSSKEKAMQQLKVRIHELDYDEERARLQESKRREEKSKIHALRERFEELSARLAAFEFKFSDPTSNFDRRSVKGFVATLFHARNPEHNTAIEVAAGGRLYQVVVDSERTGKQLLEKGKLQRRVTIIPLNRIKSSSMRQEQLAAAKNIDQNASSALSLGDVFKACADNVASGRLGVIELAKIGYEDEIDAAMRYVFGKTLVCGNMDAAKRITFDPQVRCRTVTLDGDVFDPSGTLSGGGSAQSSGPSILEQLQDLNQIRSELHLRERALQKIETEQQKLDANRVEYEGVKEELNLKIHELALTKKKLESCSAGRLLAEIEGLERELSIDIPDRVQRAEEQKAHCQTRLRELEASLCDVNGAREKAMKDAEENLTSVKRQLSQAQKYLQMTRETAKRAAVQMSVLKEDIREECEQLDALRTSISSVTKQCKDFEVRIRDMRVDYETRTQTLEEERSKLAENDSNIGELNTRRSRLSDELEALNVELKQAEHQHKQAAQELEVAEQLLNALCKRRKWLASEQEKFGKAGGEFDFNKRSVVEAKTEFEKLTAEQQTLTRTINKKVMTMFEKAEQEYQDLNSKRRIIENDKRKMERVIAELDEKKKETLIGAWTKVNRDFASIFSTLLPGASAKLEPPEGKGVMDGLEIRVGFSSVWKDSLSELSGGQRSLIALSLVLAMLLFKPAPMYILDEVDAALDHSHTQNIGRMLKDHFSGSQFIVVSLKEGMFNNANVIFRTRFVDGVSTVTRSTNISSSRSKQTVDDQDKENLRQGVAVG